MSSLNCKGTGVALITPFKKGRVDFNALEKIIQHCINGGVEYLVSLGTTGESITLSAAEKKEILQFTVNTANGKIPVVAGMSSSNTNELVHKINQFDIPGISAFLISSPAYNKPSQKGIIEHYLTLAKISPLPIILYNVPGRTASNMSAATMLHLAEESNKFIAVKEASANMSQCMQIVKNKPKQFTLLSGDDPLTLALLACGAEGVISVIANAFPFEFSEMVRCAMKENYTKAKELHYSLYNLHRLLYVEGNPAGIKCAMHIMGLCENEVRLPLARISKRYHTEMEQLLQPLLKQSID